MTNHEQVIALLNLAFCGGIFWSCIFRLNSILCINHLGPRLRYTFLLAGSMACGLQPLLFNEKPGLGTLAMSFCTMLSLIISASKFPRNFQFRRRASDIQHSRRKTDV